MWNKLQQLEKASMKVKRLLSRKHSKATSTVDTTPLISPAKFFIDNVSPTAKTCATKRLLNKKGNLPRVSLSEFRKKLDVNLSNNYTLPSNTLSTLQKDIEEFLYHDDVTKQAPDKKKQLITWETH